MEWLHPDLVSLVSRITRVPNGDILLDGETLPYHRSDLAQSLNSVAYHLYHKWYVSAEQPSGASVTTLSNESYQAQLNKVAACEDRWDRGWKVKMKLRDGTLLVIKNPRRIWVAAGNYIFRNPESSPSENDYVDLFIPRTNERLQDSFLYFFGNTLSENTPSFDYLRIYFSYGPDALIDVLSGMTKDLNHHFVPYRLKCLRNIKDFDRADTAVMYIEKRFVPLALDIARSQPKRGARATPRMTWAVAPGVAIAEDPRGSASFGLTRCHLIAAGFGRLVSGEQAPDIPLDEVLVDAFRADGLDAGQPWLGPADQRDVVAYRAYMGFGV